MNKLIAIAIDFYTDRKINNLKNCLGDANAVINILTHKYSIDEIELYAGADATMLHSVYNNLYSDLINSIDGDSILIYFAGHGEYLEVLGTSYWLCSDSSKDDVTSWFNLSNLSDFFLASKAKHIALISDSCFSGAIFELKRGGGISALDKISRQALTSGGVESVLDGIGDHSLFNLTLQQILNGNSKSILTFTEFCESTIMAFDSDTKQTPAYGSLSNSGHKGGTYKFYLSDADHKNTIQEIQLALELNLPVNIESDVRVPFFSKSKNFDNMFVNSYAQQLGYSIVSDVRAFISADQQYCIERSQEIVFDLSLAYTVEYFDKRYLSLVFNKSEYLGGMHPNHNIYVLNFAFSPDRKLSLRDVINWEGFSSYDAWLLGMIEKYAETDQKDLILGLDNQYRMYDLDFSFTKDVLTIYWVNLLPHAFKGYGFLKIPISESGILLSQN